MAYMNQERKAELAPAIKEVLKKYNVKATISVQHYSTLMVNIKSSVLDFFTDYNHETTRDELQTTDGRNFSGVCSDFLNELHAAMNGGNFDKSDSMTDYFHVGWYTRINIGQWDKPYQLTA